MGGIESGRVSLVITCEHGGNAIPEWLADRFEGADETLESHRGWDPGALGITKQMCASIGFHPVIASSTHYEARTSRLVVDLNRSVENPALFSEFTRDLPEADRERILAQHYRPYRARVERAIRADIDRGTRVVHVSVHTFTPVLGEERREYDAGILFDPAREPEASIALRWIEALGSALPGRDIRANQPYLGTDDGLTTALRKQFPQEAYIGIEVEVRNDLAQDYDEEMAWGMALACTVVRAVS